MNALYLIFFYQSMQTYSQSLEAKVAFLYQQLASLHSKGSDFDANIDTQNDRYRAHTYEDMEVANGDDTEEDINDNKEGSEDTKEDTEDDESYEDSEEQI